MRHPFMIAIAAVLLFAGAAEAAPKRSAATLDESDASRTIVVSTRGGQKHQRLTLPLDKAAIVQLDGDARDGNEYVDDGSGGANRWRWQLRWFRFTD